MSFWNLSTLHTHDDVHVSLCTISFEGLGIRISSNDIFAEVQFFSLHDWTWAVTAFLSEVKKRDWNR
jgi:hypothetical protein